MLLETIISKKIGTLKEGDGHKTEQMNYICTQLYVQLI